MSKVKGRRARDRCEIGVSGRRHPLLHAVDVNHVFDVPHHSPIAVPGVVVFRSEGYRVCTGRHRPEHDALPIRSEGYTRRCAELAGSRAKSSSHCCDLCLKSAGLTRASPSATTRKDCHTQSGRPWSRRCAISARYADYHVRRVNADKTAPSGKGPRWSSPPLRGRRAGYYTLSAWVCSRLSKGVARNWGHTRCQPISLEGKDSELSGDCG